MVLLISFDLSLAGDKSFLLFSWLLISASWSLRALFSATRASISSLALLKHKFETVLVTALKKGSHFMKYTMLDGRKFC